eukprot:TRINITY_DN16115_c0_g1_i1.p1 TRINITY_DN16115_c0_g1~~TRINITY_DN16115_c0_g1_i1.p1  ORF type:complete len:990 (+),score=294.60 TRINITY_DN16115_c0_g1_i1:110-3079(+)
MAAITSMRATAEELRKLGVWDRDEPRLDPLEVGEMDEKELFDTCAACIVRSPNHKYYDYPCVLVVSSNVIQRTVLKLLLSKAGFRVLEAAHVRDQQIQRSQHTINLVMVDVACAELDLSAVVMFAKGQGLKTPAPLIAVHSPYTPGEAADATFDEPSPRQSVQLGFDWFCRRPLNAFVPGLLSEVFLSGACRLQGISTTACANHPRICSLFGEVAARMAHEADAKEALQTQSLTALEEGLATSKQMHQSLLSQNFYLDRVRAKEEQETMRGELARLRKELDAVTKQAAAYSVEIAEYQSAMAGRQHAVNAASTFLFGAKKKRKRRGHPQASKAAGAAHVTPKSEPVTDASGLDAASSATSAAVTTAPTAPEGAGGGPRVPPDMSGLLVSTPMEMDRVCSALPSDVSRGRRGSDALSVVHLPDALTPHTATAAGQTPRGQHPGALSAPDALEESLRSVMRTELFKSHLDEAERVDAHARLAERLEQQLMGCEDALGHMRDLSAASPKRRRKQSEGPNGAGLVRRATSSMSRGSLTPHGHAPRKRQSKHGVHPLGAHVLTSLSTDLTESEDLVGWFAGLEGNGNASGDLVTPGGRRLSSQAPVHLPAAVVREMHTAAKDFDGWMKKLQASLSAKGSSTGQEVLWMKDIRGRLHRMYRTLSVGVADDGAVATPTLPLSPHPPRKEPCSGRLVQFPQEQVHQPTALHQAASGGLPGQAAASTPAPPAESPPVTPPPKKKRAGGKRDPAANLEPGQVIVDRELLLTLHRDVFRLLGQCRMRSRTSVDVSDKLMTVLKEKRPEQLTSQDLDHVLTSDLRVVQAMHKSFSEETASQRESVRAVLKKSAMNSAFGNKACQTEMVYDHPLVAPIADITAILAQYEREEACARPCASGDAAPPAAAATLPPGAAERVSIMTFGAARPKTQPRAHLPHRGRLRYAEQAHSPRERMVSRARSRQQKQRERHLYSAAGPVAAETLGSTVFAHIPTAPDLPSV